MIKLEKTKGGNIIMERSIREQFSDMAVVLSIKEPGTKGFAELYREMLEFLYNLDGLYFILSTDYMDKTRGISVPLALKPNKQPSIYAFTDLELAQKWCAHYRHLLEGTEPIAYLKREDDEYRNVFQIAFQLGIFKCVINEGDRMLALNIADMIQINNLNQNNMILNVKAIESYLIQGKMPRILTRFKSASLIGFEISQENKEYLADTAKNIEKDFSDFVRGFGAKAVMNVRVVENEGLKIFDIVFPDVETRSKVYLEKGHLAMEKEFFETVEKYDSKKLFDSRYSYLNFMVEEQ